MTIVCSIDKGSQIIIKSNEARGGDAVGVVTIVCLTVESIYLSVQISVPMKIVSKNTTLHCKKTHFKKYFSEANSVFKMH